MDVLSTHAKVVEDYAKYIQSFLNIADPEIHATVEARLSEGRLWPEPLLQFNPAFESAGTVAEVAAKGIVHPDLVSILKGYSLYRHQVDAIQLGAAGKDFIVTSGMRLMPAQVDALVEAISPPAQPFKEGEFDPAARPEIGAVTAKPEALASVQAALQADPPQQFDIARKVNVFNAFVEFVELSLVGTELRSRLQKEIDHSRKQLVQSVLPGLKAKPPEALLAGVVGKPTVEQITRWIDRQLDQAFPNVDDIVSEMRLVLTVKAVTFEMLKEPKFQAGVREAYPDVDFDKPFSEFTAARSTLQPSLEGLGR